jgi:hypothetical protein
MFYAKLGSPQTNLSGTINNLDTDIYVTDGNALPDAPNVLIIYDDNNLEVIKYSTKVGNKLGNCTRGYGGSTALNWDTGKVCGRFITSIEHNNMKDNIEGIYKEVNTATYQAPVTTNNEVNQITTDKNKLVKVDIRGKTVADGINPEQSVGDAVTRIKTKDKDGNTITYFPIPYPLRSLPNGTIDEIKDGKLTKRIEKNVLDGNLNWQLVASGTGFKRVSIIGVNNNGYGVLYKYNNKILPVDGGGTTADSFILFSSNSATYANQLFITIPNADSGWGENYYPTVDEIKAYFFGWRMYNYSAGRDDAYNNTGVKGWYKISDYSKQSIPSVTTTLPTTTSDNYTPYRLYYQLATPIITELNLPNLVAVQNGNLVIESDAQNWVRPTISYSVADNEKANIDELIKGLSDSRRYKKPLVYIESLQSNTQAIPCNTNAVVAGVNLKIPEDGTYIVFIGGVWIDSFPEGKLIFLYFNNVQITSICDASTSCWNVNHFTNIYKLAKGTFINIQVEHYASVSHNLAGCYIRAIKVGDLS